MALTVSKKNYVPAKDIIARMESAGKNKKGKVGWIEKSRYPDSGVSVASVAAVAEYGDASKNIPPRPIFRAAIVQYREKWQRVIESSARRVLRGEKAPEYLLERQVLVAAGDVRRHISTLSTPPLAMSTIMARVSRKKRGKVSKSIAKPLVDTGILLTTLTGIVE